MKLLPRDWRREKGFKLKVLATVAGVAGANPSRTYQRFELGAAVCPATVIENVREFSNGVIGAESWQAVRLQYLAKRKPLATVAA